MIANIQAEHEKLNATMQKMEEGIDKKEKEIRSQMRTEKDEIERAKTDLNTKAAELANAQAKALDSKAARPQGVEQDPLNPQHMGLGDFPDAPMDGRGVTPATPDADLGAGLGATIPVHSYGSLDEVSTPERDVMPE